MRTSTRHARRDGGFSALELTIASTIGLLVLSAAYMMLDTSLHAFNAVDANTRQSREVGATLHQMARTLRETMDIADAQDYSIRFSADSNDDGIMESITYALDGTTRRLTVTVRLLNSPYTLLQQRTMASNVRNVSLSQPLFSYWESVGTTAVPDPSFTPPKNGDRLTRTHIITVRVSTQTTGAVPTVFEDSTDVFLRNAQ
ncbi:MAG: hypothetical protein WC971_00970 [Coriobacteriia bacterium]